MSWLTDGHNLHAGLAIGPALLIAFFACWKDLQAWMHRQGDALAPTPVLLAALLSGAAGVGHGLAVVPHFAQAPLVGLFFAATTAAQLGWSYLALTRPQMRGLLPVAASANLGLVALWAISRTVGVPLAGPGGGRQAVGALDLVVVLAEVGLVGFVLQGFTSLARARRSASSAAAQHAATTSSAVTEITPQISIQFPTSSARSGNATSRVAQYVATASTHQPPSRP